MPKIGNAGGKGLNVAALIRSSREYKKIPPQLYYGPRRVGKTVLAATASEDWRGNSEAPIELGDMLYIAIDEGALDSLVKFNASIKNVLHWSELLSGCDNNATLALSLLKEALPDLVSTTKCKFVVIDTISQLDWSLQETLDSRAEDMQTFYRLLLGQHKAFSGLLNTLEATVIELCHAQPVGEIRLKKDAKPDAIKAAKADRAAKFYIMPDVEPAISGQSRNVYLSNTSLHGAVLAKMVPNKGLERRVYFAPNVAGFEATSRFDGILDVDGKGEEPNLRDIYQKIGYL